MSAPKPLKELLEHATNNPALRPHWLREMARRLRLLDEAEFNHDDHECRGCLCREVRRILDGGGAVSDCQCRPCRVCGYKHSCNLMVEHKTTIQVGNKCPAKKVRVKR